MNETAADSPFAPPSAVLETCLHVSDLERARAFYQDLFGYPVISADARLCAFNVGGTHVLILFAREDTATDTQLPFGVIPGHATSGSSHVGFSIPAESLDAWRDRLERRGIPVESSFIWPAGGTSLYFRDPDGHLLELLTPGVWPMY